MPRRHHHVQELPHTCLPAALRIAHLRLGIDRPEAGFREALGPTPWDLHSASAFGVFHRLDFTRPEALERLLGVVDRGWCLVEVLGGPAAAHANALSSPHGALAVAPRGRRLKDVALPHHVIVLVDVEDDALVYLDPWFDAEGQPLRVGLEPFVARWWTGAVLKVRPSAP